MNDITLFNQGGRILASSREVAEKFSKQINMLMRDIRAFNKDVSNFGLMFVKSEYQDTYGRTQKEYLMNRDGFSLLCIKFTSKKLLEWE